MKKTALILMLLAIISKIMGFFREIVLSYNYGTSFISDAYLISLTIPGTIFAFVGMGIATTFVPIYNAALNEEGKLKGDKLTNNLVNITILLATFIVLFTVIFTPFLVKLFAMGFNDETFDLAVNFTRITVIGVYFYGVIYLFEGYLRSNKSFIVPALMSLPYNSIIIISIILSSKGIVNLLVFGNVAASACQMIFLYVFVRKRGYIFNFGINFKCKYVKRMLILTIPVILGLSANQINILIGQTMASTIIDGGISALHYANRLNQFIQGVVVLSIATVMYPTISKMAVEKNIIGLKTSLKEAIINVNLLVIPCIFIFLFFSRPLVEILYGRGAFGSEAITLTASALFFYSIGMIGFGLREVLSRGFYSMQDTKTPMINAAIGMTLNIVLNIILSKQLGIGGIALAASISAIFTTMLMFISLKKKLGSLEMKSILISSSKILIASLSMGILAKISYTYFLKIFNLNTALILAIIVGAMTYLIIIYIMKVEGVSEIINLFKQRISKTK